MAIFYHIILACFLLLCFLLCVVILMQESKSMGLGASFGGDVSDSIFGTATADVLKRFTAWMAFLFLGACVLLSAWTAAIGPSTKAPSPVVIEEEAAGF